MQTAPLIVVMAQRRPAQYENVLEARPGREELKQRWSVKCCTWKMLYGTAHIYVYNQDDRKPARCSLVAVGQTP
jgi:hypothetical protein